jgi:hypothetical protein
MSKAASIRLELPDDLDNIHLPDGVEHRLNSLLHKQDNGNPLSDDERREAEGLVELADFLSLLRLRAETLVKPGGLRLP